MALVNTTLAMESVSGSLFLFLRVSESWSWVTSARSLSASSEHFDGYLDGAAGSAGALDGF